MRIVAYDDQIYRHDGDVLWTERTFPLFIAAVGANLDGGVELVGRLDDEQGAWNHRVPDSARFSPLPYYASLADPRNALGPMLRSIRQWWRLLKDADGAWVLGPHPLGIVFALLTLVRGRRLCIGVRQDLLRYTRNRHGRRPVALAAAFLLEGIWRLLALCCSVVVVGPELARQYRHARRLHQLHVSMVPRDSIVEEALPASREYEGDGQLEVLSVGRIDAEKNPLLLADVLAELVARDPRWRMTICGGGPLEGELVRRMEELGLTDRVDFAGYVPLRGGLLDIYRRSHVFLHVSWTEGVPQVLFECFASRLPLVATDVGGIGQVTGSDAALLIGPGDRDAAVRALERIRDEPQLRERQLAAGGRLAHEHTLEAEAERVAVFLAQT